MKGSNIVLMSAAVNFDIFFPSIARVFLWGHISMSEEERYQNFLEAMKLLGVELPTDRLKGINISIQLSGKYWVQCNDPHNRRQTLFELKETYPDRSKSEVASVPTAPPQS